MARSRPSLLDRPASTKELVLSVLAAVAAAGFGAWRFTESERPGRGAFLVVVAVLLVVVVTVRWWRGRRPG